MKTRCLLKFCLLLSLLLAALPLPAQQIAISKDNKTIEISTTGEASALADTAVVTIGFIAYGKDQDATYADASRTSNAIITALTTGGVPKDAIQSTQQNLSPLEPYTEPDKARYAQGVRFVFSQSWRVAVPATQAANILHLAITSGANQSGNIEWQLRNDDALQADAARKALQHAREVAQRMAEGLGARLGSLVYASNQTPPRNNFNASFGAQGIGMGEGNGAGMMTRKNLLPLAISPERITKSATVYAVFAIE